MKIMNNYSVARRKLLQLGTIALGTTIATKATAFQTNSPQKQETIKETTIALDTLDENCTPEKVLEELLLGNQRFVGNKPESRNQDYIRLQEVSKEQKPFVSIMSCADSRVPVEVIFDRGFGDLFVVRDAGNIATPEEIGSLEYGTCVLGSKLLMVIGHEKCGAVKAALEGKPLPGQMGSIIAAIQPAINRANKEDSEKVYTDTIKQNVMLQVKNLNSSPLLHDLVEQGKLKIVGAYYSLTTGQVSIIS
jgi:carbonic anhydrase